VAHPLRLGDGVVAVVSPARGGRVRNGTARRTRRRHRERDVMNFIARLRALLRDSSGQDLLEYALLVALIALVCVAVITSTGSGVRNIFQAISNALTTATPAP
jgi:pilus assembly protein Flp/PilA